MAVMRHGIRWGSTALLLWGVYGETGPWTVAALSLVFVALEIIAAAAKRAGLP